MTKSYIWLRQDKIKPHRFIKTIEEIMFQFNLVCELCAPSLKLTHMSFCWNYRAEAAHEVIRYVNVAAFSRLNLALHAVANIRATVANNE